MKLKLNFKGLKSNLPIWLVNLWMEKKRECKLNKRGKGGRGKE